MEWPAWWPLPLCVLALAPSEVVFEAKDVSTHSTGYIATVCVFISTRTGRLETDWPSPSEMGHLNSKLCLIVQPFPKLSIPLKGKESESGFVN